MILDTIRGPIEASRLAVHSERTTTPAGTLVSTSYLLDGEVVKIDQSLEVSEAALAALGDASL